jgi:hypothetical protein
MRGSHGSIECFTEFAFLWGQPGRMLAVRLKENDVAGSVRKLFTGIQFLPVQRAKAKNAPSAQTEASNRVIAPRAPNPAKTEGTDSENNRFQPRITTYD